MYVRVPASLAYCLLLHAVRFLCLIYDIIEPLTCYLCVEAVSTLHCVLSIVHHHNAWVNMVSVIVPSCHKYSHLLLLLCVSSVLLQHVHICTIHMICLLKTV